MDALWRLCASMSFEFFHFHTIHRFTCRGAQKPPRSEASQYRQDFAARVTSRRMKARMIWRGCGCGCLVVLLLGLSLLAIVLYRLSQVPKTYPPVAKPLIAPSPSRKLGGGLEG